MTQLKVGFIGFGNISEAIVKGMLKSKKYDEEKLITIDLDQDRIKIAKDKYKINIGKDLNEVLEFSDVLFLSVKPNAYKKIIGEIKDKLSYNQIIVSVAAGITILELEKEFAKEVKIVRTMPNTPALYGEAMTAICKNKYVTKEELASVKEIFDSIGKTEYIEENIMPAFTAISGSSPAYVYMFIEALADGAVLEGMPRKMAYKIAAQAVLGASKVVLESKDHPAELKDQVCSPGGTTIEAMYEFEKKGFRGIVMRAVRSCSEKVLKISGK